MDINTCYATTWDLRSLALYANLVPAVASIILAIFVLIKSGNRQKASAFASFVAVFSLWLVSGGIIWVSNNYHLVTALWTPIDYFALLFYLLLFCFFYLDTFDSIPTWLSVMVALIAGTSFWVNFIGEGAFGFDQTWCNVNNNAFLTSFNLTIETVILLSILAIGSYRLFQVRNRRNERVRVALVTGSIVLFMGVFAGAAYVSSITDVYTTELYALFTLPIFIMFLTVAITSYGTFRLGNTVAQVLFYILIVTSGANFFFVDSSASLAITAVAFLMTLGFGIMLTNSFNREARARAQVEILAKQLEQTNERQETLIHFIGHEVKGFLTKDAGAFAALSEGDLGPISDGAKAFAESALTQSRAGAASVGSILKASNLKKGTVTYDKKPLNLNALVVKAVANAKSTANAKGLTISFTAGEGNYQMVGDGPQIADHVLRNLIENAINYTPTGSIEVSLQRSGDKIAFAVKDSGIGISGGDKKYLFTEGGHGKDSQKVNVHSTGYGLYIAKQIVEAHGGTIRAESEGEGKGSTFVAEFPT